MLGEINHAFIYSLTHWGRAMHICVRNLTIIGSDDGLSPGRRNAIIWTNAGILLIGPLGTNFSEILIKIHTFSFKKMHFRMSFGKWQLFYLSLNVLKWGNLLSHFQTTYLILLQLYSFQSVFYVRYLSFLMVLLQGMVKYLTSYVSTG